MFHLKHQAVLPALLELPWIPLLLTRWHRLPHPALRQMQGPQLLLASLLLRLPQAQLRLGERKLSIPLLHTIQTFRVCHQLLASQQILTSRLVTLAIHRRSSLSYGAVGSVLQVLACCYGAWHSLVSTLLLYPLHFQAFRLSPLGTMAILLRHLARAIHPQRISRHQKPAQTLALRRPLQVPAPPPAVHLLGQHLRPVLHRRLRPLPQVLLRNRANGIWPDVIWSPRVKCICTVLASVWSKQCQVRTR